MVLTKHSFLGFKILLTLFGELYRHPPVPLIDLLAGEHVDAVARIASSKG